MTGHESVIFVTGAGRGIGLQIVIQLLDNPGIKLVVAVDLNVQALEDLSDKHGPRLYALQGDVSRRATSQEAVDAAVQRGGRLNAMILNAGMLKPIGTIAETKTDDWKRLFDVNFFALLHSIQASLPELRKSKGKIVMTSSGVSLKPYTAWAAYACTKASMNYLCGSLQLEEPDVLCLCITPGIVDTEMQKEVRDQHEENMPQGQYDWLNDLHKEGKLVKPEQPAAAFVKVALEGVPSGKAGTVMAWDAVIAAT